MYFLKSSLASAIDICLNYLHNKDIFVIKGRRVVLAASSFKNFNDYIFFLRDSVDNLVDLQTQTGTQDPSLLLIQKELFNKDPFVMLNASLAATVYLANEALYH